MSSTNLHTSMMISIRPEFTKRILTGEKKFEFRRTRPSVRKGCLAFIYSSSPTKAVVAKFRVKQIVSDSPKKLWELFKDGAGITKEMFFKYVEGKSIGCCIAFDRVQALPSQLTLGSMMAKGIEFKPPQSFRYLDDEAYVPIRNALDRMTNGSSPLPPPRCTQFHEPAGTRCQPHS